MKFCVQKGLGESPTSSARSRMAIRLSCWGSPKPPDLPLARPAEHALRRGFALPAIASSCTSAQKINPLTTLEDELQGESNSISNQENICQGGFHPKDEIPPPINRNSSIFKISFSFPNRYRYRKQLPYKQGL